VAAAGAGGLSGAPLKRRALEVLRRVHARTGDQVVLIASGGIETADDAWERITAGATLVQAYTGFVYGGPFWPHRIHAGLAQRAREAGFTSIQQAIGTSQAPATRRSSKLAAAGADGRVGRAVSPTPGGRGWLLLRCYREPLTTFSGRFT
jgi:dihydroorotate dehydrogenase